MTGQDSSLRSQITAIILAGGQGKRMGGQDKGLINFEHKPLIQYVIEKILPQVEHIIINANRNISAYGAFGYPVISDTMNNYQGPLAGFLAAMISAPTQYIARPATSWHDRRNQGLPARCQFRRYSCLHNPHTYAAPQVRQPASRYG